MTTDDCVGRRLGGYRIDGLIARGGMGVVYRATQLSLDRPVALKVIAPELAGDPTFRERFLREAQAAASLDHPHVLPVFEAGTADDGTLFLSMRLVEGDSLADVLHREGRLDPARAIGLVGQVAEALGAAHAAGLVHRDVKPANVLLAHPEAREHAYLCDFGLARPGSEAADASAGTFAGTARYAAPEQIRGESEADPSADLYSLACVLYECLAGHPPFPREDELALLWAHLHEPAPPPSESDPALAPFDVALARALAKDPGERFASAAALAQELRRALDGPEAPAPAPAVLSLPTPATSFLGREDELAAVLSLLIGEGQRLLTLTGSGGTGKSRLALQAGAEAADAFPDGVVWVPLAPVRDAGLVPAAIAQALELQEQPRQELWEVLIPYLSGRRMLLLLDNAEHLLPEMAAHVTRLLQADGPAVIVTSRERLRVQGERVYPVPPLNEADAVELLLARAAQAGVALTADEAVSELCSRLDQLPLALELAAARTTLFSPAQLLERVSDRLDLLKAGRDADPRQHTLRATIEWSHDLLAPAERQLFARLSVFGGGCSFGAAADVCEADADTLQALLEKSLVNRSDADEPRYWLLETIREFAAERLEETSEGESTARRHAAWFADLARRPEGSGAGAEMHAWLRQLESEHDNLRLALEWAARVGEDDLGAGLAADLSDFWLTRGHMSEGRRWLELWLERGALSPQRRAQVLHEASSIAVRQGDDEDVDLLSLALLEEATELGDDRGVVQALAKLTWTAVRRENFERAAELQAESSKRARQAGDRRALLVALTSVGLYELRMDRADVARPALVESVELAREAGVKSEAYATSLFNLGLLEVVAGGHRAAAGWLSEALALYSELNDDEGIAYCLSATASIAVATGDAEAAASLLGASGALLAGVDAALEPVEEKLRVEADEAARAALPLAELERLLAAGASLEPRAAERFGAEWLSRFVSETREPPPDPG